MNSLENIIDDGLCLGCGICNISNSVDGVKYDIRKGQWFPNIKNDNHLYKNIYQFCPGKGYDVIELSKEIYNSSQNKYYLELGYVDSKYIAYSCDNGILKNASSGGLITQILIYLLKNKIVDKVVVSKFFYSSKGPRAKAIITNSISEIYSSQGSKYCPVDFSEIICNIVHTNDKLAVVGIPCQIAGLRLLQNKYPSMKNNIKFFISNFCGGFKNYNNIRLLAKRNNIEFDKIKYFRFRGDGQPGSLLIRDNKTEVSIQYPKYVSQTGISKHLRCHFCVDATGELADISCGDAWLPNYLKDDNPWSIVISRTAFATNLIEKMKHQKYIIAKNISIDDIILSQKANISSKKIRQKARMKLYKRLKYNLPHFDGGYVDNLSSLGVEISVFIKHIMYQILEYLHLYYVIILIRKLRNRKG